MTPTAQEIEALARRLCWNAGYNPDQVVHGAYSSHAEPPCVQTPSGRAFLCFNPEPLWKSWMAVANSALKFMREGELSPSKEFTTNGMFDTCDDADIEKTISRIYHDGDSAFDISQAVTDRLKCFFPLQVRGKKSNKSEYGVEYETVSHEWSEISAENAGMSVIAQDVEEWVEEWASQQLALGNDVLVWREFPTQKSFPDEGVSRVRWRCHTMKKKDMYK